MGIYIQRYVVGDMKVVVISGSPRKNGLTQVMMKYVYNYAKSKNQDTKLINLSDGQIECYRGYGEEYNEATKTASDDITDADVWLIGTPIYNSFFSSALKNLFEYINYKKNCRKGIWNGNFSFWKYWFYRCSDINHTTVIIL